MACSLPTTLEGQLLEGQRLYSKVSDANFEDDSDRDHSTERAREVLEALQRGVAHEGVFSSNEEIDDISTSSLPFLAADYYLGSLLLKLPFKSPETRLLVLERAESLLSKYLSACEHLSLLEEADHGVWQSLLKKGRHATFDAGHAINREQRIERFRRQKRTRQRIKEIEEDLARADTKDDRDDTRDDHLRRKRALLLLSALASDALDELSGLTKETEVLVQMVKARESGERGQCEDASPRSRQSAHPAHSDSGLQVTRISRVGGSLEIRKESVRAAVFKPTVELPTMTVEEFGEVEVERARQSAAADKGNQGAPPPRRRYDQLERDGDEDDADLVEQAAIHDRDWDNWKDDHPRGAGNKANKRI